MNHIELKQDILQYIEEASKDKSTIYVIIHQSNTFHTMGAGIAKVLSNRYPSILEADKLTKKGSKEKLGTYSYSKIYDNVYIVNAYGQHSYGGEGIDGTGRNTDYEALFKALQKVHDDFNRVSTSLLTFVVPLNIGQGLAKGDPNIIQPKIRDIFQDDDLILIYN